jgi:DNA-binding response OmpR family regulator
MLGLETMQEFQIFKTSFENIHNLNENVCIIGMSATASNSEQAQGFSFGMDLYCQKPVDTNALLIILKTLASYFQNEDFQKNNEFLKNLFNKLKSCDKVVFPSSFSK